MKKIISQKKLLILTLALTFLLSINCSKASYQINPNSMYQKDLAFLKMHVKDLVILTTKDKKGQVLVAPSLQGRVLTSTPDSNLHSGWINMDLIKIDNINEKFKKGELNDKFSTDALNKVFNAFGGEDRFWLGPEGGQFSIFFPKGDSQKNGDNWVVPAGFDRVPWNVTAKTKKLVRFSKAFRLKNASDTQFEVLLNRTVKVLEKKDLDAVFQDKNLSVVAFETDNILKNNGANPWKKETGLLSIWVLNMFQASSEVTIIVPYQKGSIAEKGKIVVDDYFGKVPAERLKNNKEKGILYFNGDAKFRSKIGLSPQRAKNYLGSYDSSKKKLTVVYYNQPEVGVTNYVNSLWEKKQANPYQGDVVNSYNDDSNFGQFYELETSSPAYALKPGESTQHIQKTINVVGEEAVLNKITLKLFGVTIEEIKAVF